MLDNEVKAIKIRSQLHKIRHNTMSGYRTICGKTASFGHQVYRVKSEEITCLKCALEEVATQPKETRRQREDRERHEAFEKQCQENEAKGLTWMGYTKTFDGESIDLYINNTKMTCKVTYDCCASPHMEFKGEPNILTNTGYRSHFMQGDLKEYGSLKEAVAAQVEDIIRHRYMENSKAEYTLTWEPSLVYLKHSPEQLRLFGKGVLC